MPTLLTVSLAVNVVVLVPVVAGLLAGARWAESAYGAASPARQILLAVYAAILALSLLLLEWHDPGAACAVLALQIAYKILTPFTVGTLRHPVVLSNLAIAALHVVTLAVTLGARS